MHACNISVHVEVILERSKCSRREKKKMEKSGRFHAHEKLFYQKKIHLPEALTGTMMPSGIPFYEIKKRFRDEH